MTGLLLFGMPEDRAETHRQALLALREELASHDLRGRMVERLHLHMYGWHPRPLLLPPELDVYRAGRLIATVTVVDVPGDGGAWYLIQQPDGMPLETRPVTAPSLSARSIATRGTPPATETSGGATRPTT
ncbi:hypothetical protein ABGB17_07205 [Sphaerisporangium sp. B11E5]|uniref:hypothetical protein n=1 Tax=Sphaerisporangium sp. B11E5 TaxID=3153563 RepID=UPI00325D0D08